MKRLFAIALTAFAASAMLTADLADAARLGGGRSIGAQRRSVAPPASPSAPSAAPAPTAPTGAAANPVMPPGAAASRAAPGAAAAPAAAATTARTGMSRWMGPLAGLAAGLGLAWLASSLGLSEALMSALLIGLAVVVGIALIRFLLARRTPARPAMPYASAGAGLGQRPGGYETQVPPGLSSGSEPALGGARPTPAVEPSRGRYPPGFDPAPFLEQARRQFHSLQAAYDAGDRALLADVMTPELFAEVAKDLDARRSQVPTEVVALNPEIAEVTTEGDQHWASVRFSGLIREDGATYPRPFDEMWNLVKPADGSSGWLLAGIRQLDTAPVGHA